MWDGARAAKGHADVVLGYTLEKENGPPSPFSIVCSVGTGATRLVAENLNQVAIEPGKLGGNVRRRRFFFGVPAELGGSMLEDSAQSFLQGLYELVHRDPF